MNVFAIIIAVKHHKNPCEVSTAVRGNPCDIIQKQVIKKHKRKLNSYN